MYICIYEYVIFNLCFKVYGNVLLLYSVLLDMGWASIILYYDHNYVHINMLS